MFYTCNAPWNELKLTTLFSTYTGEMTSCPGYIGVTINDLLASEELFRYDLLILCPDVFNLTFRIPISLDRSDAAFHIRFTDPQKSYDVSLSHATRSGDLPQDVAGLEMAPTSGTNRVGNVKSTTLVNVAVALFLGLAICFAASYICLARKKFTINGVENRERCVRCRCSGNCQMTLPVMSNLPPPAAKFPATSRAKPTHPRAVVCIYIVLWSVYSLSFTVTIFFYILTFALRPEAEQLSRLSDFKAHRTNITDNVSAAMDRYRATKILRQERLVSEMQRACTNHVGDLYNRTAAEIIGILLKRNGADASWESSYRDRHPASHVLEQRLNSRLESYRTRVSNYSREFRQRVMAEVQQSMRNYRKALEAIHRSGWLSFAQWVFNESNGYTHVSFPQRFETLLSGDEVDFGMFLEVEEIEVVELWWVQLWERQVLSTMLLIRSFVSIIYIAHLRENYSNVLRYDIQGKRKRFSRRSFLFEGHHRVSTILPVEAIGQEGPRAGPGHTVPASLLIHNAAKYNSVQCYALLIHPGLSFVRVSRGTERCYSY